MSSTCSYVLPVIGLVVFTAIVFHYAPKLITTGQSCTGLIPHTNNTQTVAISTIVSDFFSTIDPDIKAALRPEVREAILAFDANVQKEIKKCVCR